MYNIFLTYRYYKSESELFCWLCFGALTSYTIFFPKLYSLHTEYIIQSYRKFTDTEIVKEGYGKGDRIDFIP